MNSERKSYKGPKLTKIQFILKFLGEPEAPVEGLDKIIEIIESYANDGFYFVYEEIMML